MATAVNDRSDAVAAMAKDWPMLEALMGGTGAMRAAGEALLPRWPNEEPDAWKARKHTATLFPAFRRTVTVMAGKPFAKPVTLSEDTPPDIRAWADDIDREGVNLHTFSAEMLQEALAYGLCGILVDAPQPIAPQGAVVTRAEEKAAGVRPYFVRVKHDQLLGWRIRIVNGVRTLEQLRILERVAESDGDFGEKVVEQVRVLEPGAWRIYRKTGTSGDPQKDWIAVGAGVTGLPRIPFVPLYGFRRGFMDGVSPLLDVAFLNVKHWQSQSDQDTILHFARAGILALIGADEKTTLTIGPGVAVKLPLGAEMKWVEHSGASIGAGKDSLGDLEQQMIQAGAELLVKQPGQRTATESASDAEANKSDLQRIVESYEDGLDQALQLLAEYANLASGGNVTLFKDFGAATLTDASAQLVVSMWAAKLISAETAIKELQRRGMISADLDPLDELQRVAAEHPDATLQDETAALNIRI